MPRKPRDGKTRQVFAAIDEDLYLNAKSRAAEMRVPLRELIELALSQLLEGGERQRSPESEAPAEERSIWDDEYLQIQSHQPVGSPVELATEEAARVARAAFGSASGDWSPDGKVGEDG